MKKTLVAIFSLLVSFAVSSQTIVTLQKEFTPQVLNGESAIALNGNRVELEPGKNQLAVTIGQIVFEDGKKRKFDSDLLVLAFEATKDQLLTLNYKTFRTIQDAKAFSAEPTLELKDNSGQDVAFELVQLRKNGLQGFRDYQRELADYNQQHGMVMQDSQDLSQAVVRKSLKQSFNEMSRQEQQAFMQWAMQNLK